MAFTLRINDGVGTTVYTDAELLKQYPAFSSTYEQGRVTQPNATLRIPKAFLGEGDWFALPEIDGRALVESSTGVVLLNGRVQRRQIEYDEKPDDFIVQVVDDATDKAKEALRAVRLTDLPETQYDALEYESVAMLYPIPEAIKLAGGDYSVTFLKRIGFFRWYKLISVVEQVFAAAGIAGAPAELYDLVVRFEDDGEHVLRRPVHETLHIFSLEGFGGAINESTITTSLVPPSGYNRNSLTLPNWDGWKLVEEVCKLCGWTFRARYGAFPSEALTAYFLPDLWEETAGLDNVDALTTKESYTLRRADPWKRNLALAYREPAGYPDLWQAGDDTISGTITSNDPEADSIFTAPPFASNAAHRWVFDGDGKAIDAEELSIDFALVRVAMFGSEFFDVEAFVDVDDGSGNILTETRVWGYPLLSSLDDQTAYIGSIRFTADGYRNALAFRRIFNGTATQMPFVHEAWLSEAFRNYEVSRIERDVYEAKLNVSDLGAWDVGELAKGVEALGRSWALEELTRETELEQIAVKAFRPKGAVDRETDQPYLTGAVRGARGEFRDQESIAYDTEVVRLRWEPPKAQHGRAFVYDVQIYNFGTAAWEDVVISAYSNHVHDFAIYNDDTGDGRHARYRIRAVMIERTGVGDTYGPWTELRVYF